MNDHPETSDIDFGLRLRELLKNRGMKSKHLADKLGVQPPAVSRWLRGRPGSKHLIRIAAVLEVDLDYLITGKPSMPAGTGKPASVPSVLRFGGNISSQDAMGTRHSRPDPRQLIESMRRLANDLSAVADGLEHLFQSLGS